MSQQDNFAGGFMLGALLGGVLGGAVGALAASRRRPAIADQSSAQLRGQAPTADALGDTTEENMEIARRRLEDKIAQLNDAIDDVRHQLGGINGHAAALDDSPLID